MFSGCSIASKDDISGELDAVFSNNSVPKNIRQNNAVGDFSYYLPSDMSDGECDYTGCIMNYGNSKILMNLNISSIINSKYYSNSSLADEKIFDDKNLVYEKKGIFINIDSLDKGYYLRLYDYGKYYQIHFATTDMNFYAYAYLNNVVETVKHIFLVAKSVSVKNNEIIGKYSNKEVIDYQKKKLNLFEYIIPTDGKIDDLLIDKETETNTNDIYE